MGFISFARTRLVGRHRVLRRVLLDLVRGDGADADGAQGGMALGPVQLLAAGLVACRHYLQRVVSRDASNEAGGVGMLLDDVLFVNRGWRGRGLGVGDDRKSGGHKAGG